MITLGNLLDIVICESYIEVYTSTHSEDHTVLFFGTEGECPQHLKGMEVAVIYANGAPDDECLYVEVR